MLMSCRETIEYLADYLDRSLPWKQRAGLWFHLLLCRHCRRYLRSYSQSIRLARTANSLSYEQLPQVPEELVKAILRTRDQSR